MQVLTFELIPLVDPGLINKDDGVLIPLFNIVLESAATGDTNTPVLTGTLCNYVSLWKQQPDAEEAAYLTNLTGAKCLYPVDAMAPGVIEFKKTVGELMGYIRNSDADINVSVRQAGPRNSKIQTYHIAVTGDIPSNQPLRFVLVADSYREARGNLLYLITTLQHHALLHKDPGAVLRVQAAALHHHALLHKDQGAVLCVPAAANK
jgi:hypothetical protein